MAGADAMRERIEAHPWPRGGVEVVRANKGYTLYSRRTGGQVARLRPTGKSDDVQVLWWRREGWATPGDFGPVIMPLNEAIDFVASEVPRAMHASDATIKAQALAQPGAQAVVAETLA